MHTGDENSEAKRTVIASFDKEASRNKLVSWNDVEKKDARIAYKGA